MDKNRVIYWASVIAIGGNAILAVAKLTFGILANSLAVVGDGLDTAGDIVSSAITLYAAKLMAHPPDKKHPYGYYKADAIASKVLSFIVMFAGLQLLITTGKNLLTGAIAEMPAKPALYVTIGSIIGKIFLTLTLFTMGKKAKSSMILANAKNMRGDIVISASVLIGLAFTFVFHMPILDTIMALLVSLWIIWVGLGIFKETTPELMDGVEDTSIYDKIFQAVNQVDGAYRPHRTRVRKVGSMYIIDLDIEVNASLSVLAAHKIAMKVENCIKECVENVYDIVVHIEPLGNHEEEETYGVSERIHRNG